MPYPRYGGGNGQDGENYRKGFSGAPNPWQGSQMNTGMANVNPMALVGNLVGAMVGQMASGGGGGGLGALMALQGGHQQQIQRQSVDGWPHGTADRGVRQVQVANPFLPSRVILLVFQERERRRRRSRERSSSVKNTNSNFRSRSRERRVNRERRGR